MGSDILPMALTETGGICHYGGVEDFLQFAGGGGADGLRTGSSSRLDTGAIASAGSPGTSQRAQGALVIGSAGTCQCCQVATTSAASGRRWLRGVNPGVCRGGTSPLAGFRVSCLVRVIGRPFKGTVC